LVHGERNAVGREQVSNLVVIISCGEIRQCGDEFPVQPVELKALVE